MMRKVLMSLAVGVSAIMLLAGCADVTPLNGHLYTDVQGPVAVGSESGSSKTGMAKATAICGVALGDASIAAAMANGGITKVNHVDTHVKSILGVYATYETVVYGE
jgi:TRL-like protein family